MERDPLPADHLTAWLEQLAAKRAEFPSWFPKRDDVIVPQSAVQVRAQLYCTVSSFPSPLCTAGQHV